MKAIILAAGIGKRLGTGADHPPKCLLRFGGKTLLQRHLDSLEHGGVNRVVVGVGYRAERVEAALALYRGALQIETVPNPDYRRGSMVTLWTLREYLKQGDQILLMDADVLYDYRLLRRLLDSPHRNCFLLDRDFEPGEEPVKLCLREDRLVEFRKRIEVDFDECGESAGFFRFSPEMAARLAATTQGYIDADRLDEPHEEAIRDLLLADPQAFGYEDITGLPWIEIDFPADVTRACHEILPRLEEPH